MTFMLYHVIPGITLILVSAAIFMLYSSKDLVPRIERIKLLPPPIMEDSKNVDHPTLWRFSRQDLQKVQEGIAKLEKKSSSRLRIF